MTSLKMNLDADMDAEGSLAGFPLEKVINLETLTIATLNGGTESGLPSVSLIFDLPDGRKVIAQTTLRLFLTAADTIRAKHSDLLSSHVNQSKWRPIG